jgi:hypothetical protein
VLALVPGKCMEIRCERASASVSKSLACDGDGDGGIPNLYPGLI